MDSPNFRPWILEFRGLKFLRHSPSNQQNEGFYWKFQALKSKFQGMKFGDSIHHHSIPHLLPPESLLLDVRMHACFDKNLLLQALTTGRLRLWGSSPRGSCCCDTGSKVAWAQLALSFCSFGVCPFLALVTRAIRNPIRGNRFARIIRNWNPYCLLRVSGDSPESIEVPIRAIRVNRANQFARITPIYLGVLGYFLG